MATDVQTISKEDLLARIDAGEDVQIVNVLDPEKYTLGMIPGSLKIPLTELDRKMRTLDKSKEIITYCAGYQCPASRQAAEKLADSGFDAKAYEGGITEWTQSGLPTE